MPSGLGTFRWSRPSSSSSPESSLRPTSSSTSCTPTWTHGSDTSERRVTSEGGRIMAVVTARTLRWYSPPRVARAMRQARRYPLVPIALLTILLVIPAILAPQVAPCDPLKGSLAKRLRPPVWQEGGSVDHLLGTDKLGRDILSRMMHGARVSLAVSLVAILVGGIIGTVIIVLVVLLWARYARLVRAETLSIKERDFIARARVAGASHTRIMTRYIFPNVVNSLTVLATLQVGYVIL